MSELFNGFGKLFETNNHGNGYFYEENPLPFKPMIGYVKIFGTREETLIRIFK